MFARLGHLEDAAEENDDTRQGKKTEKDLKDNHFKLLL